MAGSRRPGWPVIAAVALLAAAVAVVLVVVAGGDDEAEAQTVRFQKPTEDGPDPFTRRADVRGNERVDVGSGPFGGTGSDLVCDRELLIRSLRARPDRLEEWARVLGVDPAPRAVARYIRKLRPVTLTRDTRVTNHSFVGGRAQPYQAILQAGTAVLVDKDGKPVARCRCGNPLLEPVFIKEAKCVGCPPRYEPPPPCDYYDFDDTDYRHYDDSDYKRAFDEGDFEGRCYVLYFDPPAVATRARRPPPAQDFEESPAPAPEPVPDEPQPTPETEPEHEPQPEPEPQAEPEHQEPPDLPQCDPVAPQQPCRP